MIGPPKEIMFTASPAKCSKIHWVDPQRFPVSPGPKGSHLKLAPYPKPFRRPRLLSTCSQDSSKDIERCDEKTLSASSRETNGITGRAVEVPLDTVGLLLSGHGG